MIGVCGIYPHRVKVYVNLLRPVVAKSLSAIVRDVQLNAKHIDALVIVRVNANLAEVHGARVGVTHLGPGRARILRSIDAALSLMFYSCINDIGIAAIDIESYSAFWAFWNALRELDPCSSSVC